MNTRDGIRVNGKLLYVAGPMTGIEEFNFPAFAEATAALRRVGYVVISPAEMDIVETGTSDMTAIEGVDWTDALERDLVIVAKCDGIAYLDGWEASKGARLEIAACRGMGKPAKPVQAWYAEAGR